MKHSSRILSLMLIFGVLMSMATGCGKSSEKTEDNINNNTSTMAGESLEGETVNTQKTLLTIAIDREPTGLTPGGAVVNIGENIMLSIYDTLLKYDENLVPQPNLAIEWKTLDDTTWEFKLRDDAYFTNGDQLTSKDVLYSMNRLAETMAGGLAVAQIDLKNCKAVDDFTVQIKTYKPYAYLEAQLCQSTLVIVSERAINEAGEDAHNRNPVGSGPYKLSEWGAGDHITLVRNDSYWGEPARIETINFRIMTEAAARTMNLESGDIDVDLKLQVEDIERVKASDALEVISAPGNALRYIAINTSEPPLNNVNVRKALAHATDTELIRLTAYGGDNASNQAFGTVPSSLKDHVDTPLYEYDPEKARELLKQEGYPDGFELTINYLAGTASNMTAEILQSMWNEVGVKLVLAPLESGTLTTMQNEGKHQLGNCGSNMKLCNAGEGLYSFFHSDSRGTSQNRTWLVDPEVDDILMKAMAELDEEARGKYIQEAQLMINDLCPTINICYPHNIYAYRKDLRGLVCAANDMINFSQLYFVNTD